MNEIHKEINKIKRAGAVGVTNITKINDDGNDVRVYIERTCFSVALNALQAVAEQNNKIMYITTDDCKPNEFIIRIH